MKNSRWRMLFLPWVALATIGAGHPPPRPLSGVITQIEGAVQVAGTGTQGLPLASPWQVVRAGIKVHVPKGGSVGIVCSNHRFVRLAGPASWSLSESTCAAGKELTPGEYSLVVPQGGRFRVVEGIMVIEREIRTDEFTDPLAPIVLEPRTVLRSPRPRISWSRVPSATEYEIKWTGRGVGDPRVFQVADVNCSEVRDGLTVCSLPWPADRAALFPGEIFYLKVSARSSLGDPWHYNPSVKVETHQLAVSLDLERRLRGLESLGLQDAALDTARASLLADRGLLSDAAELYRRSFSVAPSSELRTTLADLHFAMGLHFLAAQDYREALAEGAQVDRAAATFGLGRIAYARDDFREAEEDFRQAAELYSSLSLVEEAEAARRAESRAKAKIKKTDPKAPGLP